MRIIATSDILKRKDEQAAIGKQQSGALGGGFAGKGTLELAYIGQTGQAPDAGTGLDLGEAAGIDDSEISEDEEPEEEVSEEQKTPRKKKKRPHIKH